ncbi:hypothetical protein J1614_005901 [Plenodomus biglobosus]|nr:hypothetical protein J1614_005901 [Plenodomus biglobosus]
MYNPPKNDPNPRTYIQTVPGTTMSFASTTPPSGAGVSPYTETWSVDLERLVAAECRAEPHRTPSVLPGFVVHAKQLSSNEYIRVEAGKARAWAGLDVKVLNGLTYLPILPHGIPKPRKPVAKSSAPNGTSKGYLPDWPVEWLFVCL